LQLNDELIVNNDTQTYRITEAGDFRITEAGESIVVEG
jgi:hypothetical protein